MLRVCTSCAQKNRIPEKHAAETGRCGKCKSPLPPSESPIEVESEAEFDALIKNVPVPILVDFWAAWCGPCRMAAPEVAELAKVEVGQALVLKVDTEKLSGLSVRFGVQSIPMFMVFKDGKILKQQPGVVKASEMKKWIGEAR